MNCPKCDSEQTTVIDSREPLKKNFIRRRRKCINEKCGFRFTTHESFFELKEDISKKVLRDIRKVLKHYEQDRTTVKNPYLFKEQESDS